MFDKLTALPTQVGKSVTSEEPNLVGLTRETGPDHAERPVMHERCDPREIMIGLCRRWMSLSNSMRRKGGQVQLSNR